MDYYKKYIKYKTKYSILKGHGYEYLYKHNDIIPVPEYFTNILNKYFDKNNDLNILEIGIGNGLKSISKSKLFKSYVGLEPNDKLFELATENCKKFDCKIKIIHSDIQNYNTEDKYDVIILEYVFHFFNSHNKAIDKIVSLLKPNGIIFIIEPKAKPIGWGDQKLNEESDQFDKELWTEKKKIILYTKEFLKDKSKYYDLEKIDIYIIKNKKYSPNKKVYHGSFAKFDVGEPKLNTRIGTKDDPNRIKYKGYAFHVTPEKYVALSYLYDKKSITDNRSAGISLYNKNYQVYIRGTTNLEDTLELLYGKGGYLYHFEDNEWFVWFNGLGDLERITFDKAIPIKRDFIKDPVKAMKDEGVKFIFEKVD